MAHPVVSSDETFHCELQEALAGNLTSNEGHVSGRPGALAPYGPSMQGEGPCVGLGWLRAPAQQTSWQTSFMPQNAWRFPEEGGPSQGAERAELRELESRAIVAGRRSQTLGPPADTAAATAGMASMAAASDLLRTAPNALQKDFMASALEPQQPDAETMVSVSDSSKDVLVRLLRQLRDLREETRMLTEPWVKRRMETFPCRRATADKSLGS